jgi:branched-chain amino acid transport system permease protein
VTEFTQQLINGLAAGSIYALIATGYSLVYGILELINFTHGYVYMMGSFVVLSLMLQGVPFPAAIAGGLVAGMIIALLIERLAYRPLRKANRIAATVSAVGAALVLQNVAQLIWGAQTRPFPAPLPSGMVRIGDAMVSDLALVVLGTASILATGLWFLVQRTAWGRSMRAIRDDLPTAELMGIDVNRMVATVYAIGAALGVVAAVLFSAYYNVVYVGMGFPGTMNAFTAAVIGGIGSMRGAFAGGLLLGVIQALAVGYIASGFANSISFLVLILVLILRPNGLFGEPRVSRA